MSTIAALDRLAADADVETIVVVSKPPAAERGRRRSPRTRRVCRHAGRDGLPRTRPARPHRRPRQRVAEALGVAWPHPRRWGAVARAAAERLPARAVLRRHPVRRGDARSPSKRSATVASNIPLAGQPALDATTWRRDGHTFIDFGDDQLTVGRPHPMIDATLRLERLRRELADPDCAVVLLDVVLGHGAHPDPADRARRR